MYEWCSVRLQVGFHWEKPWLWVGNMWALGGKKFKLEVDLYSLIILFSIPSFAPKSPKGDLPHNWTLI